MMDEDEEEDDRGEEGYFYCHVMNHVSGRFIKSTGLVFEPLFKTLSEHKANPSHNKYDLC